MLIVKKSENREKALAYIRVSSQRQVDEGVSLDNLNTRVISMDPCETIKTVKYLLFFNLRS